MKDPAMEQTPPAKERRMVLRLLGYWRDARTDDAYPTLDQILELVPDHDQDEILSTHVVFKLENGADHPTFRQVGPFLVEDAGMDPTGQPFTAAPEYSLLGQAFDYFDEVAEATVPISLGGEFIDGQDRKTLYRGIILPLSETGETQAPDGTADLFLGASKKKIDES